VDLERAKSLAPGAAAYASAEELVGAGDVDAVVIATPPGSHFADAQAAAAGALPTLVEKPPASEEDDARALAELDPAPWIGFNRRFDPAVRRLRDGLDRTGPLQLKLTFDYRRAAWRARMVADEPLLDVGTHLVDLARWLTGSDVRRVRARTLTPRGCRLDVDLEHAVASIACTNNRPYYEGVIVRDAKGSQLATASRGGLVNAVRSRLRPQHANPLLESLSAELAAFCRAVRGEASGDLATAQDGAAAMAAVEGARRSAALDREWVDVPADVPRH
jgi:myo-inositol 2-dehydrogenase / D-chiro-inositol 1-dehydrogenase